MTASSPLVGLSVGPQHPPALATRTPRCRPCCILPAFWLMPRWQWRESGNLTKPPSRNPRAKPGFLPLSVKPGEEEQEGGRLLRNIANLEGKFQLGFHASGSRGRDVKGSSWEGGVWLPYKAPVLPEGGSVQPWPGFGFFVRFPQARTVGWYSSTQRGCSPEATPRKGAGGSGIQKRWLAAQELVRRVCGVAAAKRCQEAMVSRNNRGGQKAVSGTVPGVSTSTLGHLPRTCRLQEAALKLAIFLLF